MYVHFAVYHWSMIGMQDVNCQHVVFIFENNKTFARFIYAINNTYWTEKKKKKRWEEEKAEEKPFKISSRASFEF